METSESDSSLAESSLPSPAANRVSNSPPGKTDVPALEILFAFGFTGLCIGWLSGMSVTPVVASVIAAILAAAGSILAAVAGLETVAQRRLRVWPLAVFVGTVAIGSILGIFTRTNNFLGADPVDQEIARWEMRGVDKNLIVRRAFSQAYPPSPGEFPLITDVGIELKKWEQVGISDPVRIGDVLLGMIPEVAVTSISENNNPPPTFDPSDGALLARENADACQLVHSLLRSNGNNWQQAIALAPIKRWQALSVIADTQILREIFEKDLCK